MLRNDSNWLSWWTGPRAIPLVPGWPSFYWVPSHTIFTTRLQEIVWDSMDLRWFALKRRFRLTNPFNLSLVIMRPRIAWFGPGHKCFGIDTTHCDDDLLVQSRYERFGFDESILNFRGIIPEEKVVGSKEFLVRLMDFSPWEFERHPWSY